ncbi:hypothetical protein KIH27_06715 [Mycobacterium sp. M1]|uniref:Low molecular weight antigen MTB12-like C-terminal domain-containing protein n=1 Tax=Mycolicibacter acidiphilus TaxID=2835306 RepID=A0ABS5RG79_9MYCO|nr:hypothetical protein [Mycolicibacter acidiphilus]MBS9533282.1 hypothetical protein [Mycolicibacter acidiphilus]
MIGSVRRRAAGAAVLLSAVFGPVAAQAEPDPPPAPTPTVDQVLADLARITDPAVGWQEKTDVVEPGFAPDEGAKIDDHLNRLNAHGYIPFTFVVTDIQPAPNDYAGSTVSIPHRPWTPPGPIVLVKQGEQWKVTHDTAMTMLNAIWGNVNGGGGGGSFNPMQPGTSGMMH